LIRAGRPFEVVALYYSCQREKRQIRSDYQDESSRLTRR
jgi:hypothetical protein